VKHRNVAGKPRVFVTDGSYRNGLAAVRALGEDGFRVTVGEREGISLPDTVSFWSRHCAQRFRYPDPRIDATATVAALAQHFKEQRYVAALPVGLEMTEFFMRHRQALGVPVMLPPEPSFAIAADKRRTFEHAATVGIPIPRTVPAARWREIDLPVVFKHPRTGVLIANTYEDAVAREEELGAEIDQYVAQEFVPGENGFGYFGFFQDGDEVAHFMHERLVQYPKEGGPSVVARAIRNPRLHKLGRALLESLEWNGAAMVEFKRSTRDGEFYLMEINPKLWGSLDLAIAAGCNFPSWIVRHLMDGSAPQSLQYADVTYQWVIPIGLKSFVRYPEFRAPFVRNLLSPKVKTDLRWSDPLPTAAGLVSMAASAARQR
jgi:predicted ATP-grasp superfamily ATP-dependent carboligase